MRPLLSSSVRLALVLVALSLRAPHAAADVIYQTGFEAPTFTAGLPVAGQDNWSSRYSNSTGAGVITTDNPRSGLQALRVTGADLQPTSATDGLIRGAFRHAPDNFDAVALGLPVVRVEVDVRLDGPRTSPPIAGDLISANLVVFIGPSGQATAGELILSSDGHVYGFGFNSGVDYLFGAPVTLGEYHQLAIESDFERRETGFYLDGQLLGTSPFDPGFTSNIFWRGNLQVLGVNPPSGYNPADYTAYYDNYRVIAQLQPTYVPEPTTTLLWGLGAVGAVFARRRLSLISK